MPCQCLRDTKKVVFVNLTKVFISVLKRTTRLAEEVEIEKLFCPSLSTNHLHVVPQGFTPKEGGNFKGEKMIELEKDRKE